MGGRLGRWLDETGAYAILVRPDRYIYGRAATAADIPVLIERLLDQIATPVAAPAPLETVAP